MNLSYLAPILLLTVSNVFMTFAWARSVWPQANGMIRWIIPSDERPELERGAGGLFQDKAGKHRQLVRGGIFQ